MHRHRTSCSVQYIPARHRGCRRTRPSRVRLILLSCTGLSLRRLCLSDVRYLVSLFCIVPSVSPSNLYFLICLCFLFLSSRSSQLFFNEPLIHRRFSISSFFSVPLPLLGIISFLILYLFHPSSLPLPTLLGPLLVSSLVFLFYGATRGIGPYSSSVAKSTSSTYSVPA